MFAVGGLLLSMASFAANAFERTIQATVTRGKHAESYTYTVCTNMLRIARTDGDRPHAVNLVALDGGEVTLVFPHNHSFVRLNPHREVARPAGFPDMPLPRGGLPPGLGPQTDASAPPGQPTATATPGQIGPVNLPDMPPGIGPSPEAFSRLPRVPHERSRGAWSRIRSGRPELTATLETTNLLGYACTRYELRQRGGTMDVWATAQLVPFHAWLHSVPPRHCGPRALEETWAGPLQARKLFPLRATMKDPRSGESIRFEYKVTSITSGRLGEGASAIFRPPADYHELDPPPY